MALDPLTKRLSVEIEPPTLYDKEASIHDFITKITELCELCDFISITNRHSFHMATLTAIKKAISTMKHLSVTNREMLMHLTTRLNAIETYKLLQDAKEVGVKYLLPLLGDPRGPDVSTHFRTSLDLLRFTSYLATGNKDYTLQIKHLKDLVEYLPPPMPNHGFRIGTVVDVNPYRVVNGKEVFIRTKELDLVSLKLSAGAEYFITQALFSADHYFDFIDHLDQPLAIGAGLIPARLFLPERIGVPLPTEIKKRLKGATDTNEIQNIGNKITAEICADLQGRGAKWIHIYSFGSINNVYQILGDKSDFITRRSDLLKRRQQTNVIFSLSL